MAAVLSASMLTISMHLGDTNALVRIKMARDLDFSEDPKKQEAYAKLDLDRMHWECCETEAACLRLDSPVVYTHCDMLSGNVLVPRNEVTPFKWHCNVIVLSCRHWELLC